MVNELVPGNLNAKNMPVFCKKHVQEGRTVYREQGEKGLEYKKIDLSKGKKPVKNKQSNSGFPLVYKIGEKHSSNEKDHHHLKRVTETVISDCSQRQEILECGVCHG